MSNKYGIILRDANVCDSLRKAWQDSNPGDFEGHEEGGFIVQDSDDKFQVIRWPKGEQNLILVPPHHDCKIDEVDIVASFHTHPNTASEFLQEPSETDKRAVRDDPDLKGAVYCIFRPTSITDSGPQFCSHHWKNYRLFKVCSLAESVIEVSGIRTLTS